MTLLLFPILRRLLVFAAVLAVPVVVGEIVARKLIGEAVSHAVATRIGVTPKIGFGATPLLLQVARGRLAAVSVTAVGAHIDGLPPMDLSATLRDVHLRSLTSLQGAIGSLSVDTKLPAAGVRVLLATPGCIDALPRQTLAGLTRDPRVALFPGRVDLLPPHGRAAEVRLRPYASGGSLRFAISGVEVAGAPISTARLAAVRGGTRCSRALSGLPFGVSLVSVHATSGLLDLAFAGRDVSFSAIG